MSDSIIDRIDRIGRPIKVRRLWSRKLRGWLYAESALGLHVSLDEEASSIQLIPFEPDVSLSLNSLSRARFAERLALPTRLEMEELASRLAHDEQAREVLWHFGHQWASRWESGSRRYILRHLLEDFRLLRTYLDEVLPWLSGPVLSLLGDPLWAKSLPGYQTRTRVLLEHLWSQSLHEAQSASTLSRIARAFTAFRPGPRDRSSSSWLELVLLSGATLVNIAGLDEEDQRTSSRFSFSFERVSKSKFSDEAPARFERLSHLVREGSKSILTRTGNKIQSITIGRRSQKAFDEEAEDWCVIARVGESRDEAIDDVRRDEVVALLRRELSLSADDVQVLPSRGRIVAQASLTERQTAALAVPDHLARRALHNPLRVGISVAHPSGYPQEVDAGTLGFFVRDAQNNYYLVSNSHVLAAGGQASAQDPVLHPGTLDMTQQQYLNFPTIQALTDSTHCVASLSHWVTLVAGRSHDADVAMARLLYPPSNPRDLARLLGAGLITGVGRIVDDSGLPVTSSRVYKVGRSSMSTAGRVMEVGSPLVHTPGGDAYVLSLQLAISSESGASFCERGDSGSSLLNEDHQLVGLLCAEDGEIGWATPIHQVMKELERMAGPLTVMTSNTLPASV